MCLTRRFDPRTRSTWRWGGALAAMLVVQSLVMTAAFWMLANGSHRRAIEHALGEAHHQLAAHWVAQYRSVFASPSLADNADMASFN